MNGYDDFADEFMSVRSGTIGVAPVRAWARELPAGARVLDMGCGHGIPIARELSRLGCRVHGIDTSSRLVRAFLENVPGASAEPADAAEFTPAAGAYDGVVAWGLLFLLAPEAQAAVIRNMSLALRPGGRMLATAPWQAAEWTDTLTGRPCRSLGRTAYRSLFAEAGLVVTHEGEGDDEGGNYHWHAVKGLGDETA